MSKLYPRIGKEVWNWELGHVLPNVLFPEMKFILHSTSTLWFTQSDSGKSQDVTEKLFHSALNWSADTSGTNSHRS